MARFIISAQLEYPVGKTRAHIESTARVEFDLPKLGYNARKPTISIAGLSSWNLSLQKQDRSLEPCPRISSLPFVPAEIQISAPMPAHDGFDDEASGIGGEIPVLAKVAFGCITLERKRPKPQNPQSEWTKRHLLPRRQRPRLKSRQFAILKDNGFHIQMFRKMKIKKLI